MNMEPALRGIENQVDELSDFLYGKSHDDSTAAAEYTMPSDKVSIEHLYKKLYHICQDIQDALVRLDEFARDDTMQNILAGLTNDKAGTK